MPSPPLPAVQVPLQYILASKLKFISRWLFVGKHGRRIKIVFYIDN